MLVRWPTQLSASVFNRVDQQFWLQGLLHVELAIFLLGNAAKLKTNNPISLINCNLMLFLNMDECADIMNISGRTSVSSQRSFAVLRLTCS